MPVQKAQQYEREEEKRIGDRETQKQAKKKTGSGIKYSGKTVNEKFSFFILSEDGDQMRKERARKSKTEGIEDDQRLGMDGYGQKRYGVGKDAAETLQINAENARSHAVIEGIASEIRAKKTGAKDFQGGQFSQTVSEGIDLIDARQYKNGEPEGKAK